MNEYETAWFARVNAIAESVARSMRALQEEPMKRRSAEEWATVNDWTSWKCPECGHLDKQGWTPAAWTGSAIKCIKCEARTPWPAAAEGFNTALETEGCPGGCGNAEPCGSNHGIHYCETCQRCGVPWGGHTHCFPHGDSAAMSVKCAGYLPGGPHSCQCGECDPATEAAAIADLRAGKAKPVTLPGTVAVTANGAHVPVIARIVYGYEDASRVEHARRTGAFGAVGITRGVAPARPVDPELTRTVPAPERRRSILRGFDPEVRVSVHRTACTLAGVGKWAGHHWSVREGWSRAYTHIQWWPDAETAVDAYLGAPERMR